MVRSPVGEVTVAFGYTTKSPSTTTTPSIVVSVVICVGGRAHALLRGEQNVVQVDV
jgi:hypothetical protein